MLENYKRARFLLRYISLVQKKLELQERIARIKMENDDLEHYEGFRYDHEIEIEKIEKKIGKIEGRKQKCLTILQTKK